MDMNEKPKLSGVPETMLQTVYARAKETKTRGAIKDTKAVEIIDKINYDFSLADKDSAMHSGVVARTIVLDKLANKYLAKNKGAVVVNIACGLDTRCYRMNGYTHWYNLDLPETIRRDIPDSNVRHGRLERRNNRSRCTCYRHYRGSDYVPLRKGSKGDF